MMRDRIGNKLGVGDKVLVALPESNIFGFIAQLEEGGVITGVNRVRGGMEKQPGRILVSCVIALPVEATMDAVASLVKVHDPEKHEESETAKERPN